MPDPAAPPTPTPASRPRRTRRFVLPEHQHDERTTERIEAFLDGPKTPARRPAPDQRVDTGPIKLDTRPDWRAAVRAEAARHIRYGRPASVVIFGLGGELDARAVDRIAHTLSNVIRAELRDTDRAVRVGAVDFRILLPETGSRAAKTVADRLERTFRANPDSWSERADLCIEVASAPRHGSLEEAMAEAERRLAVRLGVAQSA